MSTSYTGNAGGITHGNKIAITEPADGDALAAAGLNAPSQKLTDAAEYLRQLLLAQQVTTWRPGTLPASEQVFGSLYATSISLLLAGASSSSKILRSVDGLTWTASTTTPAAPAYAFADAGAGTVVAVGAVATTPIIYTSTDGDTWTRRTTSGANALNAVVWSSTAGLYVAVGDSGAIFSSPDGVTWTARASGTANGLGAVAYGNGIFVAAGVTTTDYCTSTNGTTWTLRTFPASLGGKVVFANGIFVAMTINSHFYTSTDGLAWTDRGQLWNATPLAIIWSGFQFIAVATVSGNNALGTSLDGINWTLRGSVVSPIPVGVLSAHSNGSVLAFSNTTSPANCYITPSFPAP